MKINGKPVIQYIVERLNQTVPLNDIIIATSDDPSDEAIELFAKENKLNIYRGQLENVARRFLESSKDKEWEYITRINGDNIFLDSGLLSEMIKITNDNDFDFISNVKHRTFPKGMSIEIVKKEYYKNLLPEIEKKQEYYEHVTSYLYENDEGKKFKYIYNKALPEAAGIQLALDTAQDFERTENIIKKFENNHTEFNLKEILELYKKLKYHEGSF